MGVAGQLKIDTNLLGQSQGRVRDPVGAEVPVNAVFPSQPNVCRCVKEQQGWFVRGVIFQESSIWSFESRVIHSDDLQPVKIHHFVPQNMNPCSLQYPQDTIESNVGLMVAGNEENALLCIQLVEDFDERIQVPAHAVKQVTRDKDQVWIIAVDLLH